jgi:hypothetical protein
LRFDQLDEHDQYDAVWASACLLHVPKADLQGVLARIWRALNLPGYSMRASRRATPMAATPSAVTTTILQNHAVSYDPAAGRHGAPAQHLALRGEYAVGSRSDLLPPCLRSLRSVMQKIFARND